MNAPINTGDIWITQSVNAPYVDPEYPYPASVLGRLPYPMVMFRFEDDIAHLAVATEETGNAPTPSDNIYKGNLIAQTDGITICDCGKAMDVSAQDTCGLQMDEGGLPPLDHWNIAVVFNVKLNSLSPFNYLWHMGETISNPQYGLECIAQTDGRLAFRWYNGALRTVQTTDPVFQIDTDYLIGFNAKLNSIDVYVDGEFLETLALSPAQVQSTTQTAALGGVQQFDGIRGHCDGEFDELIMWEGALSASAHRFVYNQIHTPCSVTGNCEWGYDPTWDAKNSKKDPGEPQTGDVWIIEE